MRGSLLLTAAAILATSTFAQSDRSTTFTERPPAATTSAASATPTNYQFHAQFGGACCGPDFGFVSAQDAANSATPSSAQPHGPTYAVGGPNFQPSSYVPFADAVAAGERQAANSPFAQSKDATVQQMLDLVQATRAAQQEIHDDGDSAPVKWSDLKPGINPSDYLKPPSQYMSYNDAVALGNDEQRKQMQQPPSLGAVAADAKEARPSDEQPAVVVRQNADGTPRVVHKGQPAPLPTTDQSPPANSQPQ
jgi:hypothetical protein